MVSSDIHIAVGTSPETMVELCSHGGDNEMVPRPRTIVHRTDSRIELLRRSDGPSLARSSRIDRGARRDEAGSWGSRPRCVERWSVRQSKNSCVSNLDGVVH